MPESLFNIFDIWRPDEKYSNHRIPGMLVTRDGTLLVYGAGLIYVLYEDKFGITDHLAIFTYDSLLKK